MFVSFIQSGFLKACNKASTRTLLLILGALYFLPVWIHYLATRKSNDYEVKLH